MSLRSYENNFGWNFEADESAGTATATWADPLRSIDWGSKLSSSTIHYYFAPAGTYIDGVTEDGPSQGFTEFQKTQFRLALAEFEKMLDVTFVETTNQSAAEFRFGTFELDAYNAIAFMVPPGEPYAGYMGIDPDYLGWVDGGTGDSMLSAGGYMFGLLLHELAHGLGLAHIHDTGGSSTKWEGVTEAFGSFGTANLNQGLFTVMGYNAGWPDGPNADFYWDGTYFNIHSFGYEATPMALDIAVLQAKYGANTTTGAGDDVYILPDVNDTGTAFRAIWDVGGADTLGYYGSRDATIDLRPATLRGEVGGGGYVSYATNVKGGFTIANGTVIENAFGASGSDKIIGNGVSNVLDGLGGQDTMRGGGGDDRMSGGDGDDDMKGDKGNDRLNGGKGADLLNGGDGTDRADYSGALSSVRSDLAKSGTNTGDARGDTFISIEDLEGSDHDDKLFGDSAANGIWGGEGNDKLSGRGGSDMLRGGDGNDKLKGGNGSDTLVGGAGADMFVFNGSAGADRINDFDDADIIRIRAGVADMSDLTFTDTPDGVVVEFGTVDILLAGLQAADLTADDFQFA